MTQAVVTIFIVDDEPLFCMGLRQSLSGVNDLRIEGECTVSEEAIELVESSSPDIVLVDADSPRRRGLDLGQCLAQRCPNSAVIVMTSMPSDAELFEVMRIGAAAYLSKQATAQEIIAIIRRVRRGDFPLKECLICHPRIAERILMEFHSLALNQRLQGLTTPLSRREMEVLEQIRDGYANKEIAHYLCLTEQTIKSHITSILRKLDVNDRTQAVLTAVRDGWMKLKREDCVYSHPSEKSDLMKALVILWGDSFIKLWLPRPVPGDAPATYVPSPRQASLFGST